MTMNDPTVLFRLDGASLQIGTHRVLDAISLTVRQGEKVALVGPSGAGKTSLLNLLHGQQPQQCALQPQHGGLVDPLSTYHNIFIGALDRVGTLPALWNLIRPLARHRAAIEALAERLGLEQKLWQSVDRLSGGQRQRVAIGRALYRQQPIFLGDEPVSSVDPVQAQRLLTLILEQHETAVVSLHNRRLALDHFDRILVMRDGRICCDLPTAEADEALLDRFYRPGADEAEEAMPEPLSDWALSRG